MKTTKISLTTELNLGALKVLQELLSDFIREGKSSTVFETADLEKRGLTKDEFLSIGDYYLKTESYSNTNDIESESCIAIISGVEIIKNNHYVVEISNYLLKELPLRKWVDFFTKLNMEQYLNKQKFDLQVEVEDDTKAMEKFERIKKKADRHTKKLLGILEKHT